MNFVELLTAVVLLVDFFLGVTFGVVGGAVYGSILEDSEHSLLGGAPDRVSAGARIVYGVHTSADGYMRGLLRHGSDRLPGHDEAERLGDGPGAKGTDPRR